VELLNVVHVNFGKSEFCANEFSVESRERIEKGGNEPAVSVS
jgi:hypothetical protein